MGKLDGKVAVVTGSRGGIGLAIAERLAADGASLVLSDIKNDGFEELVPRIKSLGAAGAATFVANLSREENAVALLEFTKTNFGRADILVNNAGGGIIRPFLEHTSDTLRETIDRNLWTTLWCCRAFIPHMIANSYGRIVNISADSVHTGIWSHAGYNAAKGGVNGLTTGLAFEFGRHNITVNAVSPGGVMTPETRALFDANDPAHAKSTSAITLKVDLKTVTERIPIGRLAEMSEVAALVAFLSYDESRAITGQIYSVNGGQWMM